MSNKDMAKEVRDLLKPLLESFEIPEFPDEVLDVERLIKSTPHIDSDEAQY